MNTLFPVFELLGIIVFAATLVAMVVKAAPRRQPVRIRVIEKRR